MRNFRVRNPETGVIHHITAASRPEAEDYFNRAAQYEASIKRNREGVAFVCLLIGLEALGVAA